VPLPTPLPLVSTFTDDDAGVELAATLSVAALSDLVAIHRLVTPISMRPPTPIW